MEKPDQTGKGISMRHMFPTQSTLAFVSLALLHCGGSDAQRPEPSSPASPQYGQSVSGRSAGEEGSASAASPRAGENNGDVDSSQVMRTAGADDAPAAATIKLTDSQIAAIANAANTAEVDEAKLAERKARNPRVKEFARMMIEHHGQAKADLAQLIPRLSMTPNTSQRLAQLQADAASTRTRLETAPAADFDQQYIDSQIEAHRKVLNALDTELIPNAINPELKSQLQSLRPKVQSHLQQAQSIRQTLGSENNGSESNGHMHSDPGNPGSQTSPGER
jgi:putative membrane protein